MSYFQGLVSAPSAPNVEAKISSQPALVPDSSTEFLKRISPSDLTSSTSNGLKAMGITQNVTSVSQTLFYIKVLGKNTLLNLNSTHGVTPGVEIHG